MANNNNNNNNKLLINTHDKYTRSLWEQSILNGGFEGKVVKKIQDV